MAPLKDKGKVRVTLYLPKHLVETARRDDLSLSALVTVLLREYLSSRQVQNTGTLLGRGEGAGKKCAGRDSNPGRRRGRVSGAFWGPEESRDVVRIYPEDLSSYKRFAVTMLGLRESTVKGHLTVLKKFLRFTRGRVTKEKIAEFVAMYRGRPVGTQHNVGKALRRFFRDYLKRPDMLEGIKFNWSAPPPRYQSVPTVEEVREGFCALSRTDQKVVYVLLATTGLRKSEVLALRPEHVVWEYRAVIPRIDRGTKRTGITFFNHEAEAWLRYYMATERPEDAGPLVPISEKGFRKIWPRASGRAGVKITPQVLRVWFAVQLRMAGVPDSFVDIFQGRAPKSVLARYYTPVGVRELKEVYDRAGLEIGVPLPAGPSRFKR